jgi:hypothetical protein
VQIFILKNVEFAMDLSVTILNQETGQMRSYFWKDFDTLPWAAVSVIQAKWEYDESYGWKNPMRYIRYEVI